MADPDRRDDCTFDVHVTGNIGFATTYLTTQRILKDSTTTNLTDEPERSQVGELVTFTAFVGANGPDSVGRPSGSVQFTLDGTNVGGPATLDSKGRAIWETTSLKAGKHQVTASYQPDAGSAFLPSASAAITHIVKRCPCEEEATKRK